MSFAEEAFVAHGAADHPIDLQDFGNTVQFAARQTGREIVFAFRSEPGRTSKVTLALPDRISIFEVDPRGGEPDAGLGPAFYKEWQISGSGTATGVLRPLVEAGDEKVTLILHGRGRGCTEASEFTDGPSCSKDLPENSRSTGRFRRPRAEMPIGRNRQPAAASLVLR